MNMGPACQSIWGARKSPEQAGGKAGPTGRRFTGRRPFPSSRDDRQGCEVGEMDLAFQRGAWAVLAGSARTSPQRPVGAGCPRTGNPLCPDWFFPCPDRREWSPDERHGGAGRIWPAQTDFLSHGQAISAHKWASPGPNHLPPAQAELPLAPIGFPPHRASAPRLRRRMARTNGLPPAPVVFPPHRSNAPFPRAASPRTDLLPLAQAKAPSRGPAWTAQTWKKVRVIASRGEALFPYGLQ